LSFGIPNERLPLGLFAVKSIVESAGVRMPSFLGYMAYSAVVLLPIFALVTWVFL
jgi:hypothetical protein